MAKEQQGKLGAEVLLSQNSHLDSVSLAGNPLPGKKVYGISPCSAITVSELSTQVWLAFSLPLPDIVLFLRESWNW